MGYDNFPDSSYSQPPEHHVIFRILTSAGGRERMDPIHIDVTAFNWIMIGLSMVFSIIGGWWLGGRVYAVMCWFVRRTDTRARTRYQDACLTRMDHHLARLETDQVGPGADVAMMKVDLAALRESILEGRASSR